MKEKEIDRLKNLKKDEENLYSNKVKYICGIDEAGREIGKSTRLNSSHLA